MNDIRTEKEAVAMAMIKFGGSFCYFLGQALQIADRTNTRKIKNTWPDYWDKYKKLSETFNIENEES